MYIYIYTTICIYSLKNIRAFCREPEGQDPSFRLQHLKAKVGTNRFQECCMPIHVYIIPLYTCLFIYSEIQCINTVMLGKALKAFSRCLAIATCRAQWLCRFCRKGDTTSVFPLKNIGCDQKHKYWN